MGIHESTKKVADWWGHPLSEAPGTQWTEVPGVLENINRRATGDAALDWITHSAGLLGSFTKPVKALSLGCGFGRVERFLRRCDFCQIIDGVDVAESAIESARKTAEAEGLDGLTYEVVDLNSTTFSPPPHTYDVVYAHACLHHVFQLEHVLDQIKQTLKPGGLFVVLEYIGPSQMQFPQKHLYLPDIFLKTLPERYRQMRDRRIKEQAARLSLETMNNSDPSEGIRASEIVPLIASRFEVKHFSYLAGTLLLLIFNEIAGNFNEQDAEIMPLVKALISLDNFLVDNAVLPSYHVYMVCQKTDNPVPIQTENVLPPAAAVFPTGDLESLTIKPRAKGSITADPNPLSIDPRGFGRTMLLWTSYATSKVEIHVGAPDGHIFATSGPGNFSQETGHWVRDGMKFYLQNVSGGLALTSENTLGVVMVKAD